MMITLSDELSSDIATAILTRQKELDRDPRELLEIVRIVHNTLRELAAKTGDINSKKRLFRTRRH